MCLWTGRDTADVGVREKRMASPLLETRGVREVSSACDRDSIAEADGGLMLPVVLEPAPGEGISAMLKVPHVGKVLDDAPVGKDVEDAQPSTSLPHTQCTSGSLFVKFCRSMRREECLLIIALAHRYLYGVRLNMSPLSCTGFILPRTPPPPDTTSLHTIPLVICSRTSTE